MGRIAPKYSERQKNALVSEHLDNKTKLAEALQMLRSGLLVDGNGRVPAVDMALSSAQDYVKRERRKRRKARAEKMSVEDPNGLLGESYSKAVETISLELHRLHYKAKSQSLSNAEVGKLERLTKMAKQHKSASVPDVEAVGSTLEERLAAAAAEPERPSSRGVVEAVSGTERAAEDPGVSKARDTVPPQVRPSASVPDVREGEWGPWSDGGTR